ncbi:MAG TPA: hypothetical protein VGV09_00630 [Steroidobacteraceae bacterium]|nr:hypothetical protein [Steroidobacteraceae bacterium]
MNASEELRDYLARLQARLRLGTIARGAAILCGIALGATPLLVLIANQYAFSAASIRGSRLVLLLALASGALLGLAIPLWRLNRLRVIRRAEARFPQFEERLRTFSQQQGEPARVAGAFGELLAADTLRVAHTARPASLVSTSLLAGLLTCGVVCVGALVWLIRSGPGYMGYGAALLWTVPRSGPLYQLNVAPGDTTLRRHADLLVTAGLVGLTTRDVRLHVRIGNAAWQQVNMQPQPQTGGYRYLLSALPDQAEYFVEAGPMQSAHFHAQVADIAQVRQIRVTYHFPAWTQLPDRIEEHGGDLRAVQGTQAQLAIVTDQPLLHGVLVLDDGKQLPLAAVAGNTYSVTVPLDKDGAYHLTTVDREHPMRITEDYFIEAGEAAAPQVAIVKPGGDYRASPIEEVTINAQAADDFGLKDFSLHYSVNGGPDQQVNLLPHAGSLQAHGGAVISLESMKLVPGDVVTVYAQAADARAQSRSQMVFVQADPYEREFSQSQQAGGGGGGGGGANQQMDISRREKEIIAGTFAQVDGRAAAARQAEQAKFLSDVQTTLRGQAMSLTGRLQSRELTDANEQFSGFQKEMSAAADAMTPAATKLAQSQWREALPDEQKALQHLLHAEATFRQIQVAFGSAGGGGGGGGSMGRDLASLSDLELDTQKNSYETAQSASPEQKRDQQIDAALKKLDELARKQEELAQEHPQAADAASERWQQEMLRRQAEELQKQLEQMAQNGQSGSQSGQSGPAGQSAQSGKTGQSGKSGQSGKGGQSGQSGSGQGDADASSTIRQAMNRLRDAQESMRRAVDQRDAAGARRAAQGLRDAMAALGGLQRNQSSGHLDELGRKAEQLADRARSQQQQLKDLLDHPLGSDRSGRSAPSAESMIDARQQLADDVGRLEQSLRDAEREALKGNRDAASKLRDALTNLDESDVQTRLQRSADLMRRNYNPASDSSEGDIPDALAKLGESVRQASRASGDGSGSDEALSAVQRFRARLAQMDAGGQGGKQPGSGQPGNQPGSGQPGSRIDPNALARGGNASSQGQGGRGDVANGGVRNGGVRAAGGGAGGYIDGGWNSGNNGRSAGGAATPETGPTPADREKNFDQGLADLQNVRRAVADDPAAKRQVDDLIRSMQQLDPRRFPGNPEVVDRLFAEVRSGVDRLELQLGHDPADDNRSVVRNAESLPVPEGYQDAVAEYYRRLSKGQ